MDNFHCLRDRNNDSNDLKLRSFITMATTYYYHKKLEVVQSKPT